MTGDPPRVLGATSLSLAHALAVGPRRPHKRVVKKVRAPPSHTARRVTPRERHPETAPRGRRAKRA